MDLLAPESFDSLSFTECTLHPPVIEGGQLRVPVENVDVFPGHPGHSGGGVLRLPQCELVFHGVHTSERRLTPYDGDPTEGRFLPQRVASDGPFTGDGGALFELEGVWSDPPAWVEWEIRASGYELRVP
jgi:hypothetical protein